MGFVSEAVSTVTTAFGNFLTGTASAIVGTFDTVFVAEGGGISNIAAWGLMFIGIPLGVKLIRSFTSKAA